MKSFAPSRLPTRLAVALVIVTAVGLGGCTNIKNQLGLGRNSPDEFAVTTRAPLTVPPDFRLRPPTPGAPGREQDSAQDRARAALAGAGEGASAPRSTGEIALLAQAGTDEARDDIRGVIDEENDILASEGGTLLSRILFWRDKEPPGTILDPDGESQRIKEASALGDPPNEGDTVIIERRDKGLFEGIF